MRIAYGEQYAGSAETDMTKGRWVAIVGSSRENACVLPTPPNPCLVLANTAVPGPVILFGIANTGLGWAWVIGSMVVCVGTEGWIYRQFRCFAHPWRVSLLLNTVSAVLGVPATLCGLIFTAGSEPIIGPTLATIVIEGWVLWLARRGNRPVAAPPARPTQWGRHWLVMLVAANLVSNAVLFGALMAAYDAFPSAEHAGVVCMVNRSKLRDATQAFLWEHPDHPQHISVGDVAPYLQGGRPQCPAGGVYELSLADMEPTCSIHGSNANPIDDDREKTRMGGLLAAGLCAAGTVLSAGLLLWKGPRRGAMIGADLPSSGLQPSDVRRQ